MKPNDLPADEIRAQEMLQRLFAQFLQPPPRVDTAEWADLYRHIVKGPEPGPWRNTRTPYLTEPMQCVSSHTHWARVVLWFGNQLGKTEVLYNAMMQRIHTDPQDMMMVQPTLADAKDHSTERFLPTLQQTPVMRGRITTHRAVGETGNWRARSMTGGYSVFFTGANSASGLSSKPLGFAVADEVDQYPADVENQGPPLGLLERRMSNFHARKLIITSTCTIKGQSAIEAEYLASDRRRYYVPCPHCGEMQVLTWGAKTDWGLKWLKTPSGQARPETAHYICQHNGCIIEEHNKTAMLRDGQWRAENPGAGMGTVAGFWLNRLYAPHGWEGWPQLVKAWTEAQAKLKEGDSGPLKTFKNTCLAETWEEATAAGDAKALAARAEDYPQNTVPRGGLMLTMFVDTQPDRLEARVWAFGRGQESWVVARHVIYGDPNLDENTEGSPWTRITEIRRTPITHANGAPMVIEATGIDSGGANTHAVYNYCRAHQQASVLATKGASQPNKPVIGKPSVVDISWRGKTIARGVKLWPLGTDTAKHLLYGRLRIDRVGPGYVHIPKWLLDTDELEQMTAERLRPVVRNGREIKVWINPPGKRNEGTDCMVGAYAMACHLGIQTISEPGWARREARYAPVELDLFSQPPPQPPAKPSAEAPPLQQEPTKPRATTMPFKRAW